MIFPESKERLVSQSVTPPVVLLVCIEAGLTFAFLQSLRIFHSLLNMSMMTKTEAKQPLSISTLYVSNGTRAPALLSNGPRFLCSALCY